MHFLQVGPLVSEEDLRRGLALRMGSDRHLSDITCRSGEPLPIIGQPSVAIH